MRNHTGALCMLVGLCLTTSLIVTFKFDVGRQDGPVIRKHGVRSSVWQLDAVSSRAARALADVRSS